MSAIKIPKKLIEVALPLDDINAAAVHEKSIRHGHPSTLHLWWARRPLAAARVVLFAQMVNDPGYERSLGRGVNKEKAKQERERLFALIRKLAKWESTNMPEVISAARSEIARSWQETCDLNRAHPNAAELFDPASLPAFHDPFAGGGAIPLEAQRLGLESFATDLNPVAILINKAMIEVPPRFAGRSPIGPRKSDDRQSTLSQDWSGARGLAEDVRRYAEWVRSGASEALSRLYPEVELPKEHGGGKATVVAWLWARTVRSPNPAYSHVHVPLVRSFWVSTKKGGGAYVDPVVAPDGSGYQFVLRTDGHPRIEGTVVRSGGTCIMSGAAMPFAYIREEAKAKRMGVKLMAVVAEGHRGRIYLSPSPEMEDAAQHAKPDWRPDVELPQKHRNFQTPGYGLSNLGDLFTDRQLVALSTFSDWIQEAGSHAQASALTAGWQLGNPLNVGGDGALAYGQAVMVYLAFALSKLADRGSSICTWFTERDSTRNTFARQAIPMTWDFAELNTLLDGSGSFVGAAQWTAESIEGLVVKDEPKPGFVSQADAATQTVTQGKVVSTDPPYYDNISYADLSDFFYVWLRRTLRPVYPDLFATKAVPKMEELVATPIRHGGKDAAERFFLDGMTQAMHRLAEQAHPAFPTTIYYAFKQSDTTDVGTGNTGWETFLEAVLRAGFAITGTWPMRTELSNRMVGMGANALASSIVLVCRPREKSAPAVSRRDFLRELKEELAEAVEAMIGGSDAVSPVAPVDLAQAVIGPGMAIFSKYSAVLEADGSAMTVHTALTLINRMLTEGADDFDADTQFCLGWFDELGWSSGDFGQATVLARAKGTSVDHVRDAGVVEAAAGKVRLLKPAEYPSDWSPEQDNNTPVWEALHQLIRELRAQGESSAGGLLAGMPQRAEPIRSLAYRLYTLCERKGWAEDARAYNELITSWTGIEAASHEKGHLGSQTKFDM